MTSKFRWDHRFGGKKALLKLLCYSGQGLIGGLSRYEAIDWKAVSRLVFVCKGNICRSAFACERTRLLGRSAISAGLFADTGKPADPSAQKAALRRNVDLAHHRSTTLHDAQLKSGDLLIAFEPEHAHGLRARIASNPGIQVTLLGLWNSKPWSPYIHDPYGLCPQYFDNCFGRIERCIEGLLRQWDLAAVPSTRSFIND